MTSFHVEENDYIVIATDGLWDNLPDVTIVDEVKKITVSAVASDVNDRIRRLDLLARALAQRRRLDQRQPILLVIVIVENAR